jgi:3-hydroxybutyryl-CoA dehydrogenase
MNFIVLSTDEQWKTITGNATDCQWIRADLPFSFSLYEDADAFFILDYTNNIDFTKTTKPVFINNVIDTLKELQAPENVYRINGWNSFLERPVWEIAGTINDDIKNIISKINRTAMVVADEPGLVAGTIIAMIINEAYFALEDGVSTKTAIDTAMQLGTNYPYGPFEWAEKTGLKNIVSLLQKLSISDSRYQPSHLLISEIMQTQP